MSGPPKKSFRQECCLNIVRHWTVSLLWTLIISGKSRRNPHFLSISSPRYCKNFKCLFIHWRRWLPLRHRWTNAFVYHPNFLIHDPCSWINPPCVGTWTVVVLFYSFFYIGSSTSGIDKGNLSKPKQDRKNWSLSTIKKELYTSHVFFLWECRRTPGIFEAEHAQKMMPKAFRFDHSTVRRVKRFLAKENQSSTPTKERDRSHLGQMPILLVWKRKRVEFRERESSIFSFFYLSKKTLRRTHYTPHTQTTSVVLPPSKSHVSRVDHIITVLSRCGHDLNWVSVKYVQAWQ